MRIAAGVIFYNPTQDNLDNLINLLKYVDFLFIYDNSVQKNIGEIDDLIPSDKYAYYHNGDNEGISKSFNFIFKEAALKGINYVLLLDQDSVVLSKQSIDIRDDLKKYKANNFCLDVYLSKKEKNESNFKITSGMIIKTEFFLNVKGYDENIFIDGVDHDYCIRMINLKEPILPLKGIYLNQHLGNGVKNLLGIYEHSSIRNYYIFRNRLYLAKKHSSYYKGLVKLRFVYLSIIKQLLSILLLESNKMEKLLYIRKAFKDFKNQRFGKIKG